MGDLRYRDKISRKGKKSLKGKIKEKKERFLRDIFAIHSKTKIVEMVRQPAFLHLFPLQNNPFRRADIGTFETCYTDMKIIRSMIFNKLS